MARVTRRAGVGHRVRAKPVNWGKILEVAVGGAIIWGFARMAAYYFSFTLYGVRVFARPFVGKGAEGTTAGQLLGAAVLLAGSLVATSLYAYLFSRIKRWWTGLVYGLALYVLFALFFPWQRWPTDTASTELAWFLSYGLFVGLSLTAERYDEE